MKKYFIVFDITFRLFFFVKKSEKTSFPENSNDKKSVDINKDLDAW